MQADAFNKSRIGTVIVVALTSNLTRAVAPGNVRLPSRATRLLKETVVNVSQLLTIDKSFLSKKIAFLPQEPLAQVEEGLRLVLAL